MSDQQGPRMEDIPFEVRSYLYEMCLGHKALTPLTVMLRRHGLEHEYQTIYSRIRGVMNMTPTCMMQLCRMYDDYTPWQMFGAEYSIGMKVELGRRMSGDVVGEVLEANGAMGDVNDELRRALGNKRISKDALAEIARKAAEAMAQISDVIDAAGRAK